MEFQLQGAYPNPCRTGTGFDLGWHLVQTDSILVTINDLLTHVVETMVTWRNDSGSYVVTAPITNFQPGIYRIYFKAIRPDSEYINYGDVQVSN